MHKTLGKCGFCVYKRHRNTNTKYQTYEII